MGMILSEDPAGGHVRAGFAMPLPRVGLEAPPYLVMQRLATTLSFAFLPGYEAAEILSCLWHLPEHTNKSHGQ